MESNASAIIITTTSDDSDELTEIARSILSKRLAACCQIGGPITSHYRWDDKLESSVEWVCTIKTLQVHFKAICEIIREIHHYDVPQIVSVRIDDASEQYLDWIQQEVI